MSNKGWVSVNRSISSHWVWDCEYSTGQAWVDLILNACHQDNKIMIKGTLIKLKRGQQARSELTLSKEWKWSRGKVRRFLKNLENDSMIVVESGHLTSVITICNYSTFQDGGTAGGTTDDTSVGTTDGHLTDNRRYTNNNVNKENNVNNDKEINPNAIAKPIAKKKFNDDDVRFAEWFYSGLISINPNHKKPNFESSGWADAVRLMREQDNRTYDEMGNLFSWVVQDSFWKSNILSPKKLREKWDALKIKSMEVKQPDRSGEGREINSGNIAALVENVKSGNKRF